MGFNTFGYNGVFEIRKEIIDKLLAQIYERTQVEINGKVSDDEFITIDLGKINGKNGKPSQKVVIYLLIDSPPKVSFNAAAKAENTVDFTVTLICYIFVGTLKVIGTTSTGSPKQKTVWTINPITGLDLGIDGLALSKVKSGSKSVIRPDFKNLKGNQIKFYVNKNLQSDTDLNTMLTNTNIPINATTLKNKIAAQLNKGVFKGIDIEIPSAGLSMKAVQDWDFRIISTKEQVTMATYDSMGVLLYESANTGQGKQTDAGNTIPQASGHPYGFALSLKADVLLTLFDDLLDQDYYTQGGTINTPSNPFGYMVVSSKGQTHSYTLPAPKHGSAKTVTVSAPQNGQVTVTIPHKGFLPRSRAHLENLETKAKVDFKANSNGGASVSINAAPGHRLAVSVYAISDPQNPKTVIWRPTITLHDKKLRIDFHYYQHIDNWCDAEGDGYVELGLHADRSEIFKVGSTILTTKVDLPSWATAVSYLVELVTGGLVNRFLATVLIHTIGTKLVTEFVSSKIDKNLKDQLDFPVPAAKQLALFLEKVDIYSSGIVLSGYADAGQIVHYGRKQVKVAADKIELGTGVERITLLWSPSSPDVKFWCGHPYSETVSNVLSTFWKADYEDVVAPVFDYKSITLSPNTPTLLWVEHGRGYAKVLVEWDDIKNTVRVTWVMFKEQVDKYIKIQNHITTTTVSSVTVKVIGYKVCYRYDGWVELETRKFFRTPITREAGLERWLWNGKEIPQDGSLTVPGAKVTWDTKNDRILVDIDQISLWQWPSGLRVQITSPSKSSLLIYEGNDAFGVKKTAQLQLYHPSCVVGAKKLLYEVDEFRWSEKLPDPPPWEIFLREIPSAPLTELIMDNLIRQVGEHPIVWTLAETLSGALKEGHTKIDKSTAQLILTILGLKQIETEPNNLFHEPDA